MIHCILFSDVHSTAAVNHPLYDHMSYMYMHKESRNAVIYKIVPVSTCMYIVDIQVFLTFVTNGMLACA